MLSTLAGATLTCTGTSTGPPYAELAGPDAVRHVVVHGVTAQRKLLPMALLRYRGLHPSLLSLRPHHLANPQPPPRARRLVHPPLPPPASHSVIKLLEPIVARHPGLSYADLIVLAGGFALQQAGARHVDAHFCPGRVDADAPASNLQPPRELPDK